MKIKPEPFKLKQFKNIPSKFMDTKDWIIRKQKNIQKMIKALKVYLFKIRIIIKIN